MDRTVILHVILVGAAALLLAGARLRHRRGRARADAAEAGPVAPETAGAPMAVGAPVRRPTPGVKNDGASRFRRAGTNVRAIGRTALRR